MAHWYRVATVGMALLIGSTLILTSHLLTARSMQREIEQWRSLGYTLTETAERCVALLPETWTASRVLMLKTETMTAQAYSMGDKEK